MYSPVTPYAGVREGWIVNDWGYKKIADNINMPMFKAILGSKSSEKVGGDGWAGERRGSG